MATINITTDTNYSALTVADGDIIEIDDSAILTIQQTTDNISEFVCRSDGEFFVENTSTTTPIFVNFGHTSVTTRFRLEAGGRLKTRGDLISIGTSDGTASQEFTLPTDAGGVEYQRLGGVFVHMPTMDQLRDGTSVPRLMVRVDAFTDCFSHERIGAVFTHDTANNKIVLGDGTNGWIPPNGAEIFIPNIQIRVTNTGGGEPFIDVNSPGRMDLQYTSWGSAGSTPDLSVGMNLSSGGAQIFDHVVYDGEGSGDSVQMQLLSGECTLTNFVMSMDREFVLGQNNTGPIVKNFLLLNRYNGSNDNGMECFSNASLTMENVVIIMPNMSGNNSSRGALVTNSQNVDIYNMWTASYNPAINFSAGSSNCIVQNIYPNMQGKRGAAEPGKVSAIETSNAIDITALNVSTDITNAEGLRCPRNAILSVGGGVQNATLADCNFDANGQLAWVVTDSGFNTRIGNINITGQLIDSTIRILNSSNGLQASNIFFDAAQTFVDNTQFGFGGIYNQVMLKQDGGIIATGTNNISNHFFLDEDDTVGRWQMQMSPTTPAEPDYLTIITQTGKLIFNQSNRFILENLNDQVVFTSRVHGGITAFTGSGITGGTTADFDIEVSMRRPDSTWTAYQTFNLANSQSQLASLAADTDNEIQVRFRVTKNTAGLNQYLSTMYLDTTVDNTYRFPFIAQPVKLTLTGLQDGSEVRIYEAGNPNNEIAGTESVSGGTFVYDYDYTNAFFGGSDKDVDIVVHALGYLYLRLSGITLGSSDTSIPIQQTIDRQYNNP